MNPGTVPQKLKGLTQIQDMSRVCPILTIYRRNMEVKGYKGHVLNLPQDVQSFMNRFPSQVADVPLLVVQRHSADETHQDLTVCSHGILEAIQDKQSLF